VQPHQENGDEREYRWKEPDLGEGFVEGDAVAILLGVHKHTVAIEQQRRRKGTRRRAPIACRCRARDRCSPPTHGADAAGNATGDELLTGGDWGGARDRDVACPQQRG